MAKRKTQEEFDNEIYEMVGNEYTFLEEYKGSTKSIKVKHNTCGNIYDISPLNFKRSKGCKKCNYDSIYKHKVKDTNIFKKEMYEKVGEEYSLLSEYINTNTRVKVKHNKCGNTYSIAPRDFLKGSRCSKCQNEKDRMTQEEWDYKVYELIKNEYTFLEHYKGNGIKISVRHNICNHEYKVKPNNFITGHRCPLCKSSIGERLISEYLEGNDIAYIPQHTFDDLKGKKGKYRYDFYLPEYNILIEYQGIQHYKPISFFGGIDTFNKQKNRDEIKKEYAVKNDIKYIEVPFYVSNEKLTNEKMDYELKNIIV